VQLGGGRAFAAVDPLPGLRRGRSWPR